MKKYILYIILSITFLITSLNAEKLEAKTYDELVAEFLKVDKEVEEIKKENIILDKELESAKKVNKKLDKVLNILSKENN